MGGIGGGGDGADLRECGTRLVGLGEREDAPLDVVFRGKGVYVYVIVTCSDDDAVVGGCDGKGFVGGGGGGGVGGSELEGVEEGEDLVGARVNEMDGAIPRGGEEDGRWGEVCDCVSRCMGLPERGN